MKTISNTFLAPDAYFFHSEWPAVRELLQQRFSWLEGPLLDELLPFLRWRELPSGSVLYRQDAPGDSMHLVVSGRLRATVAGVGPVGEIGIGECLGEMALLAHSPRNATVTALRDSVLVELSADHFDRFCERHPRFVRVLSQGIISRLRQRNDTRRAPVRTRTLALVPVSAGVDLHAFVRRLETSLRRHGTVRMLDAAAVDRHLARPGAARTPSDDPRNRELTQWLNAQEMACDFLLLCGDASAGEWTRRCLRQADKVLLVGNFGDPPHERPVEAELFESTTSAPTVGVELVLLHPDGRRPPEGTAAYLARRRVRRHHHIRLDRDDDLARLARFVSGRAVGLVLGGGGARGFAHLGVAQALREAGYPVDAVGGTSIGAILGGVIAMDLDEERRYDMAYQGFVRGRPLRGFTLPLVSLYTDRHLERGLRHGYGDRQIEDLWLPFFCVSCNLSTAEEHVHRQGLLWKAVRASMSIPGVFPPVVWEGNLHVDGGLMNNLPIDVMQDQGVGHILAVDLQPANSYELTYDKIPATGTLLLHRLFRRRRKLNVPSLPLILAKSAVLSSQERGNRLRAAADLCFTPPVGHYGVLDMGQFEDIYQQGLQYARNLLRRDDVQEQLAVLRTLA